SINGIWDYRNSHTNFQRPLTIWLGIGGLFYRKPTKMLPFSADECNPLNMTSLNMNMTSLNMNMTSLTQQQLCEA
ncbi:hypothetical protein Avbf_10817, partial [Armadillidium vulgare]